MSEIVSDNDREERERELNNKKRESYNMLLSLVVRMREHAHYRRLGHEWTKLKIISAPKAENKKKMAQICCL